MKLTNGFNKENDCDTCKNQYMTGLNKIISACSKRDTGEPCTYKERDIRLCPVCNQKENREDMRFTTDCHGIPFRLVCSRCHENLMETGYDGEYYDECDECIDYE